jgi:hypothetical protein
MAISKHLESFAGFTVRDFNPAKGIQDTAKTIYRLRKDPEGAVPPKRGLFSWKSAPPPQPVDPLEALLTDPASSQLQGLVYGSWMEEYDPSDGSAEIVGQLADAAPQLPNLKALFVGDITFEECEISWINQSDMAPLLQAYPQLQHFGVRGSNELRMGPVRHLQLKSLVIECGGLPGKVLREVLQSEFPALEHLELYLGEENYGFDFAVGDLEPLLSGIVFPNLRSLGLRDSEIADDIAIAIAKAPVLSRLKVLDLSLGTLSDAGARGLLDSPGIRALQKLDVHHHYISPELVRELEKLGPEVDASDPKEADKDGEDAYRYVAVGE